MPQITSIRKCDRSGDCNKKMTARQIDALGKRIENELKRRGISCHYYYANQRGKNNLNISGCMLTDEYRERYGGNIGTFREHMRDFAWGQPYREQQAKKPSKRRKGVRFLGWDDWVVFNDAVNDVLDKENISANVGSLKGKFVIRKGLERKGESDWQDLAYENVGSMMIPVERAEAYKPVREGREAWRRDVEARKRRAEARRAKKFEGLSTRAIKAYEKRR